MPKVKKFEFPTYEEWKENEFSYMMGKMGDYYVDIRAVSWSTSKEHPETVYSIAASTRENPLNIYSPTIYRETFHYFHDDEKNLKDWYEKEVIKFHEFWEKFILKSYFKE